MLDRPIEILNRKRLQHLRRKLRYRHFFVRGMHTVGTKHRVEVYSLLLCIILDIILKDVAPRRMYSIIYLSKIIRLSAPLSPSILTPLRYKMTLNPMWRNLNWTQSCTNEKKRDQNDHYKDSSELLKLERVECWGGNVRVTVSTALQNRNYNYDLSWGEFFPPCIQETSGPSTVACP